MRNTFVILAFVFSAATAYAAEGNAIGAATLVQGPAQVRHADSKDWVALKPGAQVHQGDRVKTIDGTAKLTFEDKSVISLAPRSEVELNEFVYKASASRKTNFKLWGGRLKASISKFFAGRNDVRITTPTAVAGVRGTEFLVSLEGPGEAPATSDNKPEDLTTNVVVFNGSVGVRSLLEEAAEEIALAAGQGTGVGFTGAPGSPINLTPEQLRAAYRSASVSSKGTLRSTVGSGQMQAASADIGGGSPNFGAAPGLGTPPIQQQPTDAKPASSLTIRVRVPGQ